MLSIDFIRENKQKVADAAKHKNREVDLDGILSCDDQRKQLIHRIQILREERNTQSSTKPDEATIAKGKKIKEELKSLESQLLAIETQLQQLLLKVPNVPLDRVPVGKDESENVRERLWGTVPNFSFQSKSHIELAESLDLVDFANGSKVSGYRGYFLKNELAQLHIAVLMFAYQTLIKNGFTPLIAPSLVKAFALEGTGQFP